MTNVLITGGAGYVGSITAHYLIEQGYNVSVVDNLSTSNGFSVPESVKVYKKDIINTGDISVILLDDKIDIVIHLAALLDISEGEENPLKYYTNNVLASGSLFKAMKTTGVTKLVNISSAAVYGEQEILPIHEDVNLNPSSNYGMTKTIIELFAELIIFNVVNLRLFNLYGEAYGIKKQTKGVIEILEGAEGFTVYGTGLQTRDYVHILDVVQAIHKSIISLENNQFEWDNELTFNVGTGKGTSLRDLIKIVNPWCLLLYKPWRKGEIKHSVADINKIKNALGYEPKHILTKQRWTTIK